MTLRPTQLLQKTARASSRAVIAMSEGSDPRIVEASLAVQKAGLVDIILVGDQQAVEKSLADAGGGDVAIHDPANSPLHDELAATYLELRARKGADAESAAKAVRDPLTYSALLVRLGHADGTIGGAVASTPDVVRAALQMIGKAEGAALVSSFFLMYPGDPAPEHARAMVYSDCGLEPSPDAPKLAAIAEQAAASYASLVQDTPKVAMLSFSTKGSARHPDVDKVVAATEQLKASRPDLAVEGELQFDAALVPSVAASKAPGSSVAGAANVMIFPDLDAGNIAYKITQRLGGFAAIGPILQGLAKPANDLSRGCTAEDVKELLAVTALQALALRTN